MQHEFIFLKSHIQYWKVIHAKWQQTSHGDPLAREPFILSHPFKDQPPKINETVIIAFFEEQHRREIVTVWADATPDKEKVKITVFFEDEAFEKTGQPAVSRWNKLKSAWIRKDWLIDPLAQLHLKKTRGMQDKTKTNIKQLRNY